MEPRMAIDFVKGHFVGASPSFVANSTVLVLDDVSDISPPPPPRSRFREEEADE